MILKLRYETLNVVLNVWITKIKLIKKSNDNIMIRTRTPHFVSYYSK